MNTEHSPASENSEPELDEETPQGDAGEHEPVLITPAGRFWEISLPPETEAALRVRGF